MSDKIVFKTKLAGLTNIYIPSGAFEDLNLILAKKLAQMPRDFLKSCAVVANLQDNRDINIEQLQQLKKSFYQQGLTLIGISNHNFDADKLFALGLADIQDDGNGGKNNKNTTNADNDNLQNDDGKKVIKTAAKTNEDANKNGNFKLGCAQIIRQNVRSGQSILALESDLVVMGAVGAGAEVVAAGNICIFGSLRGRAFAGANGDNNSFIYCSELAAELISIAGNYKTMEEMDLQKNKKNTLITLTKEENIKIESSN